MSAKRRFQRFASVVDRTSLFAGALGGIACLVMMFQVIADVIGRHFFNKPLLGTLEYTSAMWMPTMVALALAGAQLRDQHLQVTLITEKLGVKASRRNDIVVLALGVSLLVLIGYFTAGQAWDSFRVGAATHGIVHVPIWPGKIIVALGIFLLTLQMFVTLVRRIYSKDDSPEVAVADERE